MERKEIVDIIHHKKTLGKNGYIIAKVPWIKKNATTSWLVTSKLQILKLCLITILFIVFYFEIYVDFLTISLL